MKKIKINKINTINANNDKTVAPGRLNWSNLFVKYLIAIVALVCTVLIVHRVRLPIQLDLMVGEIAEKEITAQINFSYIDEEKTERVKDKVVAAVPVIYYKDPLVKKEVEDKINKLFNLVSQENSLQDIRDELPWLDDYLIVEELRDASDLLTEKQIVVDLSNEVLDRGMVKNSTRIKFISRGVDSISLRDPESGEIEEVSVDRFLVRNEITSNIDGRLRSIHPFDKGIRKVLSDLILQILSPNVQYDQDEMERLKQVAVTEVEPVYVNIRRGQTIVRHGDPITDTHKKILEIQVEKLNKAMPEYGRAWNTVGIVLLVIIFFFILYTYLHYHQPEIFKSNKKLFLLSIILVSTLGLNRLIVGFSENASTPFWQYFIIIPMSAMFIAMLIDKELAIISSIIMSFLAAVLAGQTLVFAVVNLFGSIVAIQTTTKIVHRWEFFRSGLFIGCANVIAICMVNLLKIVSVKLIFWNVIGSQLFGGIVSGMACAIVVSIFLPVLERLFDITTNMRLLELSDLNHPLLKKMITAAPGTYHHSIVISNMAEDAAFAIGANSLLAKVGGYFHDIGKITKPSYFVENAWFEEESKHEKLQPTMSNLVITAHVKDGAALGKKYKLPKDIIDIIKSHHGTSLIYYFYKQAEKTSAEKGVEVNEVDFRYPGPKPQTKEAGIILLADTIEAASKTLVKPTPAKIEELVKEISREKIMDGQLDECRLTFKDLNIIRDRFTHILTGILHKRVEYPEKNGKKNGSNNKQGTNEGKDK